ncbi:class IV adenylate cyclase [Candidatus Nomurabacteria bacterium]|nr:class IV adenylate cyclase [Candidatus Nomurabacteria bacterium]
MREIEVKAKITDKETLMKKLVDLGCTFDISKYQIDKVYFPNNIKFTGGNIVGQNILRIRTETIGDKTKSLFALKYSPTQALDKIEKEFEISDPIQMHESILMLGYYLFVEVKKNRIVGKYKDYEICIDEVEDLGSFIEVEKLVEENIDSVQIFQELYEFLEGLNVDPKQNVSQGYDILLGNLKNKL